MSTLESVCKRLQVHDARLVFAAVAGEAQFQVGRDGDAMNAGRVRDFADDLVLGEVNDHDLGPVRNVEALTRRIHRSVIPAAFAADGDFLDEMIRAVGAANRDGQG